MTKLYSLDYDIKNKKILITGSNGLLGSALKNILGSGHFYHTRKDADLLSYEETFNFLKSKKNEGVDTIIHTAARVGGVKANTENNDLFFYENYKINNNIINAAYNLKIKNFVNILSTCVFPNEKITYPLTADQINNSSPHPSNYGYSYAKRLSSYQTKIFRYMTGGNWYSIIPTNLYGPNDNFNLNDSHLIPALIHKAYLSKKNDEKFVVWGDGKPLRQFMYSYDLANLILWSLDNWNSDNDCMLINEEEISIMGVVNLIAKKFEIDENKIEFDKSKPIGQFKKTAKSDVKNYKFTPIEEGLTKTIEWFIENYNYIRK